MLRRLIIALLVLAGLSSSIPAASAASDVAFGVDATTLADFEFNTNALSVLDASSAHRDGHILGEAPLIASPFGKALKLDAHDGSIGFDWSEHASAVGAAYTIELLLNASSSQCWQKLVGTDDALDAGIYVCGGIQDYPGAQHGTISPGGYHYVAITTDGTTSRTYVDGTDVGTTSPTNLVSHPSHLLFLRDDSHTSRREQFKGLVDAIRVSSGQRSASDIQDRECYLAGRCGPPAPLPELPSIALAAIGLGMIGLVALRRR